MRHRVAARQFAHPEGVTVESGRLDDGFSAPLAGRGLSACRPCVCGMGHGNGTPRCSAFTPGSVRSWIIVPSAMFKFHVLPVNLLYVKIEIQRENKGYSFATVSSSAPMPSPAASACRSSGSGPSAHAPDTLHIQHEMPLISKRGAMAIATTGEQARTGAT
jgi:hypothetical protein